MAPDEEPKEVSADPPAPPAEPLASSPADGDNPHEKLVASLRSQIDDLFSQVSQLNSKLVQSYDRVASLEDDMHVASSDLRASSIKISQLELERTQHLSALNTGLLVEKEHVTTELSRLMERVAEESAQRGQAETARQEIEKDLDDLSATLFNQANTMVAEARWQRAQSERKVVDVEQALKGAEEAVAVMQTQMQGLREEKEAADRELSELREKGKWVERGPAPPVNGEVVKFRELTVSHWPFQEFTVFLAHVKTSLTTAVSPLPPLLSTLLSQPFIARLVAEDSYVKFIVYVSPNFN
jgi:beta-galactosidase beta subunit